MAKKRITEGAALLATWRENMSNTIYVNKGRENGQIVTFAHKDYKESFARSGKKVVCRIQVLLADRYTDFDSLLFWGGESYLVESVDVFPTGESEPLEISVLTLMRVVKDGK